MCGPLCSSALVLLANISHCMSAQCRDRRACLAHVSKCYNSHRGVMRIINAEEIGNVVSRLGSKPRAIRRELPPRESVTPVFVTAAVGWDWFWISGGQQPRGDPSGALLVLFPSIQLAFFSGGTIGCQYKGLVKTTPPPSNFLPVSRVICDWHALKSLGHQPPQRAGWPCKGAARLAFGSPHHQQAVGREFPGAAAFWHFERGWSLLHSETQQDKLDGQHQKAWEPCKSQARQKLPLQTGGGRVFPLLGDCFPPDLFIPLSVGACGRHARISGRSW